MLAGSDKPFSAIFWNVWVESQITAARLGQLTARFDDFIDKHKPDVFGLNEVLSHNGQEQPPLLAHLEKQGYQTFFVPFSPEATGHYSGSAIACRATPLDVQYHELGPDRYAEWHGHPGHTIKLIRARIPHGGRAVNVIVNYMAHLVPYNWRAHVHHHKAFRAVMRAPELQTATIIGGDFNQFKFMPRLWGARSLYDRATGTLLHPTWKLVGKIPVIQANLDNIFWTKCGKLQLNEFKMLERHPSDHAPLYGQFQVLS